MADQLGNLTLDELATLNDEIVNLTKAGVPLEAGLMAFAADGRGRANRVAEQLVQRLESGQSLAASIRNDGSAFPELYATVVEAGVRAGRLPAALEAVSEFSRELADLRRALTQAMLYPLITVIAAYGLFVVVVSHAVRHIMAWQDLAGQESGSFLQALQWAAENLVLWFWIPPMLGFVALVLWVGTGRASVSGLNGIRASILWVPGMRRVVRSFRHTVFARLTALLVEQQVPLHDALILAAGGCGRDLQRAAIAFARADEQGDRTQVSLRDVRGMRPLLQWILKRQQPGPQLIASLRTAASAYREKGRATIGWIRFAAPIFFTLLVAGGITGLYTLALFLPLSDLLKQVAGGA